MRVFYCGRENEFGVGVRDEVERVFGLVEDREFAAQTFACDAKRAPMYVGEGDGMSCRRNIAPLLACVEPYMQIVDPIGSQYRAVCVPVSAENHARRTHMRNGLRGKILSLRFPILDFARQRHPHLVTVKALVVRG